MEYGRCRVNGNNVNEHYAEQGDGELFQGDGLIDNINDPVGIEQENNRDYPNPQTQVALLLIGLREKYRATQEACSFVAREVRDIMELASSQIKVNVQSALQLANIEPGAVDLTNAFSDHSFGSTLDYYSDARNLNSYCSHNFNFVEPVEYILGKGVNGKEHSMQYVSILDTLKSLIQVDDIFAEIVNGHASHNDIILDFCDGANFKSNNLLLQQHTLQINLYNDDFCVANPLGNKAKKLKFAAFYFVLGNISPKFRSSLNIIQLICLCPSQYVKKYGLRQVIAPLLRDLKVLESDGIVVVKDNVEHNFKGALAMITADNLAAHSIGGFQESFNTRRVCRFCQVTKADLKNHLRALPNERRTEASYDQQARLATANEDMASIYGVKFSSTFNELQSFHIVRGLPSDIAHDLFEGVVPNIMGKVIIHCVNRGYFTLAELDDKLQCFPYEGIDFINKPSRMETNIAKFKVKQTAIQSWCFLRLLPLMIGKEVAVGDKTWELLLRLADVVQMATSHKVTFAFCQFFADIIESFLMLFNELFPNDSMTPKFHYITHYPQQMLEFGPLIHCWTLRFEGKHLYFKELTHRTKNKRNLCKTLAHRHEYLQSWLRTKGNMLSREFVEHSCGNLSAVRLMCRAVQDALIPVTNGAESVYTVKKVEHHGTRYWQGCAVVTGLNQEGLPCFGIVDLICLIGGRIYFVCSLTNTVEFCRHLHAYILHEMESFLLRTPAQLFDYYPLSTYTMTDNSKLVVLRHNVQ